MSGLSWKEFVDGGYIIAGSPKTVRDRLTEALKTLRCGHLMALLQFGSMPAEVTRNSTDLFAREVMPHLRGLWSEYQDRWSPHPLPQSERAKPAQVGGANGAASGAPRQAAAASEVAK